MPTKHRPRISPENLFKEILDPEGSGREIAHALLVKILDETYHNDEVAPLLQHHPLGFFCIRWNLDLSRSVRIHIWSRDFNWTQEPNWPIHDHLFSFKSVVLCGHIQNKTYAIDSKNTGLRNWTIYEVSYNNQSSAMSPKINSIGVSTLTSSCQHANSSYELPAGVFHRSTLRSSYAITALATATESSANPTPRVIGTKSDTTLTFDRQSNKDDATEKIIKDAIAWLER